MLTLTHTLIEHGNRFDHIELIAGLDVIPHAASGDGWNEPREAARAETALTSLAIYHSKRDPVTGVVAVNVREVECPPWLADIITRATQDEADELVADYFADEAADEADYRMEAAQ